MVAQRIERGERMELEVMMEAENEAGDGHPEWSHVQHGAGLLVALCIMALVYGAVVLAWWLS